jgi:rare lipoprotein A
VRLARAAVGAVCLALAGCSNSAPQAPVPPVSFADPAPQVSYTPVDIEVPFPTAGLIPASLAHERRGGLAKIGKPYQVAGTWYYPRPEPDYRESGSASWYGSEFHGKRTANGEIYNRSRLTGAHPTLPMPSYVKVTNLANGRTILVRINDRGPYKRGRIIDLSQRAAEVLGYARNGTANVTVSYYGEAPLTADDSTEERFLAAQPWYRSSVAALPQTTVASDVTASFGPAPPTREAPAFAFSEGEVTGVDR